MLLKVFAYLKGNRVTQKLKIKGPAIILSNHTSFYDFVYTTAAMYPRRVTYLAAQKMFYEPATKTFLNMARAIPKSLMQTDPVATLKAFRMLKRKGIISVFPEGQISPTGKTLAINFSIAKFLKKASVNVYIVKHHNAYLVNPPWSKKTFSGRSETVKELIISKDDLKNLSTHDIYSIVCDKLNFSTSVYNREKKYTYKLKDISNLENVIYQCPSCLYEGLEAKKQQLICPECSYELNYDSYGLLNGLGVDELYDEQAKRLHQLIDSDRHFELSSKVILQSIDHDLLKSVGFGRLTLKENQYVYEGSYLHEMKSLSFDIDHIQSLPSDIGKNVQIYKDYQIYQFEMKTPWLPTKFIHAGEYLYMKKAEKLD
ncbi:MAG: lysophospholipid acyltransferase family protein [Acholeplasmataceae bacterium]|nr:lysophospholipid acyltransferase family protein [Acholeplasmataceae bacterium]